MSLIARALSRYELLVVQKVRLCVLTAPPSARNVLRCVRGTAMIEVGQRTWNRAEGGLFPRWCCGETPATLQKIADRFGVSREAIRLSEKGLIKKIKVFMTEALGNVRDVEFALLK